MIRRKAVALDLPESVRALARCVAAGLPLDLSFRRAADALDDASADALRACAAALEAGEPMEVALSPLLDAPGGRTVVGAIEIHSVLGGDLVQALSGVAEGLADAERVRLEARAATAQARTAARVVPLAPLASLALLLALSPGAARAIVLEPAGQAMLLVALGLSALAIALLRRIARSAGL